MLSKTTVSLDPRPAESQSHKPGDIEGICISVSSPGDILSESVAEIVVSGSTAKMGTCDDEKMYPLDRSVPCGTCSMMPGKCTGHIGMIRLHEPVVNPLFGKKVLEVLSSICFWCSRTLLHPQVIKKITAPIKNCEHWLSAIVKASKGAFCVYCKKTAIVPSFPPDNDVFPEEPPKKEMFHRIKIQGRVNTKTGSKGAFFIEGFGEGSFTAAALKRVTPETSALLGMFLTHPANMIIEIYPILPKNIRSGAANRFESSGYSAGDPLQAKYNKLLQVNNAVLATPRLSPEYFKATGIVFAVISSIEWKDVTKSLDRGNGASVSIIGQLAGKTGILRDKLGGKRCNHTGRSVITPSGMNPFDSVVLPPLAISTTDVLNKSNYKEFASLWARGRVKMLRIRGEFRKVTAKTAFPPMGTIFSRLIQDGDYIYVGRQPTLSRQSLMTGKVAIKDQLTISIPSSVTTPYGADFDGDEMNVNVPQGSGAKAEAQILASFASNIISPHTGSPCMGVVFNAMISCHMMSKRMEVHPKLWDKCMKSGMLINDDRIKTLDERLKLVRGEVSRDSAALLSAVFPENFFYDHAGVKITRGILTSGTLGEKHLDAVPKSIVHMVYTLNGTACASRFIRECQGIADIFLEGVGISVGLSDVQGLGEVREFVREAQQELYKSLWSLGAVPSDPREHENHEANSRILLSNFLQVGDSIMKKFIREDSPITTIINSGAKGNASDIAQVIGSVGQIFRKEGRMLLEINGNRASMAFSPRSENPESRGFCPRSFVEGVSPVQLFFLAVAGRQGIADTAVGTSKPGTLARNVAKAAEDAVQTSEGTVAGCAGEMFLLASGSNPREAPINISMIADWANSLVE